MVQSQVEITFKIVDSFFDRKRVKNSLNKERRKRLSKGGAFIRRGARSKVKRPGVRRVRAKRSGFDPTVSRPGRPPRTHVKGKRSIRLILFAYDSTRDSVVVGPVRFSNSLGVNVPGILEKGGRSKFKTKAGDISNTFIQPRPLMVPTLREEASKFPDLFKDSVR